MLIENARVVVRVGQAPHLALCMHFHLAAYGDSERGKLQPAPNTTRGPELILLLVTGGSQCNEIGMIGMKSEKFLKDFFNS